jgi:hypothetical protein
LQAVGARTRDVRWKIDPELSGLSAVRLAEWVADFGPLEINELEMVDQIFTSWNPLVSLLRQVHTLMAAD